MIPPRVLIVFACMACWLLTSVAGADTTIIGGATRVIEADTLEVIGERVRLKGIDAPEKGQLCENASGNLYPCGQAALRALRGHIGDSKAVCGIDPQPDRYGRALGVCYLKGEDLNGWLVSQGTGIPTLWYSVCGAGRGSPGSQAGRVGWGIRGALGVAGRQAAACDIGN